MKLIIKVLLTACIVLLFTVRPVRANAQMAIVEAVRAASKKIIKAVDLKIQRLQNGVIDAQALQKKLENLLSKLKLEDIAAWTQKQKEQYQVYFDELWKVKAILTYYHRFSEIIALQKQIMKEYTIGYQITLQDKNFTPGETKYIYRIYTGMINESISGIDDILNIMKSFSVSMSDYDRLELINKTTARLESLLTDLRIFTRNNHNLSVQRTTTRIELEKMKSLYGL